MVERTKKVSAIVSFLQEAYQESGLTTNKFPMLTENLSRPGFSVSQSYAHQVLEDGTSVPGIEKCVGFLQAMDRKISELYQHLGLSTAEICGHTLTPQQQAVVDQLNTENGEYLLKLSWIFAEGREKHQRMIKDQLNELSKEAPADALSPPEAVTDLTDPEAVVGFSAEIHQFPGADPITVHRFDTAAGSGTLDLDESTIKTYAYFRSEWLSRKDLIAERCAIIGVMGESMEPALPDGCVILIDRNRTRRRDGHIFVVRTKNGLIVKRLGKDEKGSWLLVSDHPDWEPVPWPDETVVLGEVKWSAVEW